MTLHGLILRKNAIFTQVDLQILNESTGEVRATLATWIHPIVLPSDGIIFACPGLQPRWTLAEPERHCDCPADSYSDAEEACGAEPWRQLHAFESFCVIWLIGINSTAPSYSASEFALYETCLL